MSQMEVVDTNGQSLMIGLPIWNPRIANLTLLALGSSAPEIFLCFINTFVSIEQVPSEFGPMVLIGSATFNMLVVIGISIWAAVEAKDILRWSTFLITFFFGTFAYLWLFLVIFVFSPAEIQSWEAILTVLFYPLMLYCVWMAEAPNVAEDQLYNKNMHKIIARAMLQQKASDRGKMYVIDLATDQGGDNNDIKEIEEIVNNYCKVFEVDALNKVSVDQLLSILEPENPIENMRYRLGSSGTNASSKASFAKLNTTQMFHFQFDKSKPSHPLVGFKSARYTASENDGYVTVTIVKKCKHDFSFWVRTQGKQPDDSQHKYDYLTAIAGEDYEPLDQLITMKSDQVDIDIRIIDDDDIEPDEYFQVELLDEETRVRLDGHDTITTVEILDDDRPGVASFSDTVYRAEPNDNYVQITIQRKDGAKGEVAVRVSTLLDHLQMDEEDNVAIENIDFKTLSNQQITFQDCQTESTFNVQLPSSSLCDKDGKFDPRAKPMVFIIQMSDPSSKDQANDAEKFVLSKRNYCRIEVGPRQRNWKQIDHRRNILNEHLYQQDPNWCDQFKFALMFGPTMDENENMIEVTCWEALIHFVSMPWKLLFAFIPPRKLYGGWLSFIICFIMIGIVSMFLLSVISAMGCVFNIMPCIQAILMVSIGTSLPDFYASKALALDKNVTYADAAIGNVFGANAANVFIGLGIPWTIASIYYEYFEGEYYSIGFNETADITFCIVMFFILSFIVFMILFIRTTKESVLGGKVKCKTFSGLLMIILWGLFALFTILGCYEVIPSRQAFLPAQAVIATQITEISCAPSVRNVDTTDQGNGTILVSWENPVLDNGPQYQIVGCTLQIQAPNEITGNMEFQAINQYCDCFDPDIYAAQSCEIPHKYLSRDFGIVPCTTLQAQIQLENRDCKGTWAIMEEDGAVVQGCPADFFMTESSKNFNSVAFQWNDYDPNAGGASCTSIDNYIVEYKQAGLGVAFKDGVIVSKSTGRRAGIASTGSVPQLETCTNYIFRGRSQNPFCYSDYSDDVSIKTECKPPSKPGVSVEDSGCGVIIKWTEPNNEIHQIRGYTIQIKNNQGNYVAAQSCNSLNMICNLSEQQLKGSPFNLHSGDNIEVQISARNDYGDSQFEQGSIDFLATPDSPRTPILVQQGTSVIVCWDADCTKMRANDSTINQGQANQQRGLRSVEYGLQWTKNNGQWSVVSVYDQLIWSFSNLEVGSNYQFQVKASNRCGESMYSPRSSIVVVTVPSRVEQIYTERDSCNLKIYWTYPFNGGLEISRYYIQVQAKDLSFKDVTSCGLSTTVCNIAMSELRSAFNLEIGDDIHVIITAENQKGSGPPSNIHNSQVTVSGEPNRMDRPQVSASPANVGMAVLTWNTAISDITIYSYELFDFDTRITYGMILNYQYQGLEEGKQHEFSVRAVNECGYGPSSDITYYTTPSAPLKILPAIVTLEGCAARINWNRPANIPAPGTTQPGNTGTGNPYFSDDLNSLANVDASNGQVQNSPISQYKVEVKTKYSALFNVPDSDCGGYNFSESCLIDMDVLKSSPFNLDIGDRIEVRVTAFNDYGWSLPSDTNNFGATIIATPGQILPPSIYEATNNSITVTWPIIDSTSPVVYDVEYKSINSPSFFSIEETSQNFGTANELSSGATYLFRIKARNSCGSGMYSQNLEALVPSSPYMVREPSVTEVVGCQLLIGWQEPIQDGGSFVTEYNVQIKDYLGDWQDVPEHCGVTSQYTSCIITQETLSENPYNLSEGSYIVARVRVQNEWGWSDFSSSNLRSPQLKNIMKAAPYVALGNTNNQGNSLTITWNSLFSRALSVNGEYAYEIHWDKGQGFAFTKLSDISDTSFTLANYDPSRTYQFKVRSRNPCGCGPFSTVLTVQGTSFNTGFTQPKQNFTQPTQPANVNTNSGPASGTNPTSGQGSVPSNNSGRPSNSSSGPTRPDSSSAPVRPNGRT